MARSLNDWLAELAAAGKGGYDDAGNPLVLRVPRQQQLVIRSSAARDFTGAAMRGEVRRWPDSAEADDPLASFDCDVGTYSDGVTILTATLTAAQVRALPAAAPRGVEFDCVFDLWITPSGAEEEMLLGGVLRVLGTATGQEEEI